MNIKTYDRLSGVVLLISFIFSTIVAATSWDWFPTEGDWGYIAEIPSNMLNYTALLLLWITMVLYLLARRLYLRRNPEK
jgi:TRAP-type C4-dicarboxylate transport system permease small subunit